MARPRSPSRRVMLIALSLLILLTAALAVGPLTDWAARQRLEERLGDVRSVEIDREPMSWLTGGTVTARVALGDVRLTRDALGVGGSIDELDLTADSIQAGRIRVEDVRATRIGLRTTVEAVVPEQTLDLAGRSVAVVPSADDGALMLTTRDLPLVPALRVSPGTQGVEATVVGGPMDGRTIPLGAESSEGGDRGGGGATSRVDRLDVHEEAGRVVLSAELTREAA